MSELGNIGQFFSGIGSSALQGAEALGGDVMTGLKDVGTSIGGLFGGGGAVSPGTIGASANQLSMPSMATDAATTAAGSAALPGGAGAFSTGPGIPDPTAGVTPSIDMSGLPGGSAQSILSSINPQGAMASADLSTMDPSGVLAQATGVAPGGVTQLTGGAGGGGNFLTNLLKNPNALKMLGEGGLLGAELLNANRTPAGEAQIKALAANQAGFAKNQGELATAEQSGILPSGATQLFQGQLNAAEAAVRAKYAEMGMTGSTAEMQDLQAARDSTMAQMWQTGNQMAQQGWANVNQATGYQSQLLDEILASETAQGTQLGQALAAFAGAAAK